MTTVKVSPIHPALGAEVAGVDLSAPLDEPTGHALSQALAEHLALVFHDQSLTPAQYLAAASAFGPPMEQHYSQHNMPGFPLIGLIWHRNGQQPAEQWHTDHTNRERPPAATILYGQEIPSAGGGTSVASMRAAYLASRKTSAGASRRSRHSTGWTGTRTRARRTGTSTASRSSTRWCARIRCTDRGRCTFTSPRPPTSPG
jgi:taurine dioxygenase